MFDLANDIRSLSDFKRNTVELLNRLRKTGSRCERAERHPPIRGGRNGVGVEASRVRRR